VPHAVADDVNEILDFVDASAGVAPLLGTAWTIAVYLPVLFPGHRGRHDVAAGTVVLLDP
jgi:hypothetical protein